MAQSTNVLRLSPDTQRSLVKYATIILDLHAQQSQYRDKMEQIDVAYARYKTEQAATPGTDTYGAANQPCGVNVNDITVPIVISQVDSYVGYFADIFLSGFPMFPVVTQYNDRADGEALESIIDDHSIRGRYPRHMLMSFRDSAKYNFSCLEVDWCPLDIYNVTDALTQLQVGPTGRGQNKLESSSFMHNAVRRTDPYNTIWDYRVNPVDVPYKGEYAGYIELISRIELKRKLAYYGSSGNGYNTTQVLTKSLGQKANPEGFAYYTEAPDISSLVQNKDLHKLGLFNWLEYLQGQKQSGKGSKVSYMSDIYEHLVLYVRLIPQEHGMENVPAKGTPQVWKLCFINHDTLAYAQRIYSLYDMIPMLFGQPFEDGFGMQTKSLGENAIPFQQAASDLFSIRLNSARRAVVDRAIYDPKALNSSDVNAPYPAAKIPLRDGQTLTGKKLDDVYKQIPFDSRGTETVIQDMGSIVAMSDRMSGINQALQGQHVPGNKTRKQWEDTQEGAQNRMRLPALAIEYQQMLPIKELIKLNIYQYGVEGTFQDMRTGTAHKIDRAALDRIRQKVGLFKLADGFHPAEKLASTDILVEGMKFIGQSPPLQATLGPLLPQMFIHFLSLGGVKGIEQYMPQLEAQTAQVQPNPQNPQGGTAGQPVNNTAGGTPSAT